MKIDKDVISNQTVYYHDAMSIGKVLGSENFKPGSIDVIVTSPPYNIGKTYKSDSGVIYDDKKSGPDYFLLLSTVFADCHNWLSDEGVFFLNVGDNASHPTRSHDVLKIATNQGFYHLQTVVWLKSILGRGQYTASGGSRRFDNVYENVFILVKDKKKYKLDTKLIGIKYADKSNIGRYGKTDCKDPSNVWLLPYEKTTGKKVKKGHPAPFPVSLPYKCIKAVSGAKTVLDPFVGIGSTLAAAELLGVRGIGFELYPLKELIKERIATAAAPTDPVLIPHLETAIKLLSMKKEKLYALASSKKGKQNLEILQSVLKHYSLKNNDKKTPDVGTK